MQRKALDIENEIRGTLKVFGLKVGKVSRRSFEKKVCELIGDQPWLGEMVRPMLKERAVLLDQFTRLHRMMLDAVRRDEVCRRFMTIQSVGPVTG